MEMYKMEKLLQREDSDVSVASNGVHLLKVGRILQYLLSGEYKVWFSFMQ